MQVLNSSSFVMHFSIKQVNKAYLAFFLILLLASFLRFYRLSEMANFDFDQEYASNFAYSVLREFPIQLIGQGLSIQGLFMGPIYFYYLVPFFAISNLHPIGGFIGSAILGLFIITTYFFVARDLFGTPAALIASFLRTILYTGLNSDWYMTPAYSSELLVLITWWCFYKYWKGQTKILPILGLVFGLYTSIHPILFPFYLVFLALFLIKRFIPRVKVFFLTIIAFLIPISPLLIFEYLRKFFELKILISLFSDKSPSEPVSLERLIYHFKLVISEPAGILGIKFISKELLFALLFGIIVLLTIKKIDFWKNHFHQTMLIITFAVFLLFYTFFPAHVPEYYFLALSTLTILYMSATLSLLNKNRVLLIFLVLILANIFVSNIQQLIRSKWNNPSLITLHHKDFIVKEIVNRQPDKQDFYVSYIRELGWNFGFDYLFKYYGRQPQTIEAKPPIYTIVIPKSLSPGSIDISSGNIGLILPD